jgi:hypothetical protein
MTKILENIALRDPSLVVSHLRVTATKPITAARSTKTASARDKEAHCHRLRSVVTDQQGHFIH